MRPQDLITAEPLRSEILEQLRSLPAPDSQDESALRDVLRRTHRPTESVAWPPILQTPRSKVDSRKAEPATTHRGLVGLPLVAAKRLFRRFGQPIINEVLRKQVEFNESILESLTLIYEQQREHVRAQAFWRDELAERMARLEEQLLATRVAPPAKAKKAKRRS